MTNLQTPNFALDPTDIPRVEEGPMPLSRTTLQHLVPPAGRNPAPAFDSLARYSPPAVLLDFMYGVAAYKRWGTGNRKPTPGHYLMDAFQKAIERATQDWD